MRSYELKLYILPPINSCDNENIDMPSQEHKKERHIITRTVITTNNLY